MQSRFKRSGRWIGIGLACAALPLAAVAAPCDEKVVVADETETEVVTLRDIRIVTLRSADGEVIVELANEDDEVVVLTADRIIVTDENGQASGRIVVEGDGRIVITQAPQEEPRVQIGLTTEPVTASLAAQLAIDPTDVLLVSDVVEGLAAQKAGLRRYDVIAAVDGQVVVTQDRLLQTVRACKPGDLVRLRVIREGKPIDLTVTAEPYTQEITAVPLLGGVPLLVDLFDERAESPQPVLVQSQLTPGSLVVSQSRRYLAFDPVISRDGLLTIEPIAVNRFRPGWDLTVAQEPCVRTQIAESLATLKEQIVQLEALLEQLDD